MNFNQIKAFILLAEGYSVTETSKKLFCTQPSISMKIKKLENELGTLLFERINNRLYLTPQGIAYLTHAQQIMNTIHLASEHMKLFDTPFQGEIKFGTNHFAGTYFIPKIMANFLKTFPLVKFQMEISSSKQLIEMLDKQLLDFLVVSNYLYFDPNKYMIQEITIDPFALICSPDHWLASKQTCLFDEISSELFLVKAEHSENRKFIFKELANQNKKIINFIEINNLESIKKCVVNNIGISIVPRRSITDELNANLLCEIIISDINLERHINYVYNKDKLISPIVNSFFSILKKNTH